MLRQKVQSSSIDSIGYDRAHQIMEIEFSNGSIYQYFRVPLDKHWGIMRADSKGTYLAEEIKEFYSYVKVY